MRELDREKLISPEADANVRDDRDVGRGAGKTVGRDNLTELISSALSGGAFGPRELAGIMQTNPDAYRQVMAALNGQIGNDSVARVHEAARNSLSRELGAIGLAEFEKAQQPFDPSAMFNVDFSDLTAGMPGEDLDEGLSTGQEALDRATDGEPKELPHRAAIEGVLDADLGAIKAYMGPEAREAVEMVGAEAFAVGDTVVFGSDAPDLETASEEAGHALQQGLRRADEVRAIADPRSDIEAEAKRVAGEILAGSSGGISERADAQGVLSRRTEAEAASAAEDATAGAPDRIELTFGGQTVKVTPPLDATPGKIEVKDLTTDVAGLTLKSGELHLDKDWKVKAGKVEASIKIGEFIDIKKTTLEVTKGGQINAEIANQPFNYKEKLQGKVTISCTEGRLTAKAKLQPGKEGDKVKLSDEFKAVAGALDVTVTEAEGLVATGGMDFKREDGATASVVIEKLDEKDVVAAMTVKKMPGGEGILIESLSGKAHFKNLAFEKLTEVSGTVKLTPSDQGAFTATVKEGSLNLRGGTINVQGDFQVSEGFTVPGPGDFSIKVLASKGGDSKSEGGKEGQSGGNGGGNDKGESAVAFSLNEDAGLSLNGPVDIELLQGGTAVGSGTVALDYDKKGWAISAGVDLKGPPIKVPVGGMTLELKKAEGSSAGSASGGSGSTHGGTSEGSASSESGGSGDPASAGASGGDITLNVKDGKLKGLGLSGLGFKLSASESVAVEGVVDSGSYAAGAEKGSAQGEGGGDKVSLKATASFPEGSSLGLAGLQVDAKEGASVSVAIKDNELQEMDLKGLALKGGITLPTGLTAGSDKPTQLTGTIDAGSVSMGEKGLDVSATASVTLTGDGIKIDNRVFSLSVDPGEARIKVEENELAAYDLNGLQFSFSINEGLLPRMQGFDWSGLWEAFGGGGRDSGGEVVDDWTWSGLGFRLPKLPAIGELKFGLPGFDWDFDIGGGPIIAGPSIIEDIGDLELDLSNLDLGIHLPGMDGVKRLAGKLVNGIIKLGSALAGLLKVDGIQFDERIIGDPKKKPPTRLGPGLVGFDIDLSALEKLALLLSKIKISWPFELPQGGSGGEILRDPPESGGGLVVGDIIDGLVAWVKGLSWPQISFSLDGAGLPAIPFSIPQVTGSIGPGMANFVVKENQPQSFSIANMPFTLSVGESLSLAGKVNNGEMKKGAGEEGAEPGGSGSWTPTLDVQVGVADNPPSFSLGDDNLGLSVTAGDLFAKITDGALDSAGMRNATFEADVRGYPLAGTVEEIAYDFGGGGGEKSGGANKAGGETAGAGAGGISFHVTGISPKDTWKLVAAPFGVDIGKKSKFGFTVKNGALDKLSAESTELDIVGSGLDLTSEVKTFEFDANAKKQPFTIDASVTLNKKKTVGGDKVSVTVKKGSTFGFQLASDGGKKSKEEGAKGGAGAERGGQESGGEEVAPASGPKLTVSSMETDIQLGNANLGVTIESGHYDKDGFTCKNTRVTLENEVTLVGKKAGGWGVKLTEGTVKLDMEKSRVTSFSSEGLKAELAGPHGIVLSGYYEDAKFEDGKLSGTAGLKLKEDATIKKKGKKGVTLKKDSSIEVTLTKNELASVSTDSIEAVILGEDGKDLLKVTLTDGALDLSKKEPTVSGTFEAAKMGAEKSYDLLDGWLTVKLAENASVSATVKDNDLESFDVTGVSVKLNDKKPNFGGVGFLPTFKWDGAKAGLKQFQFAGGSLNGLQLGKHFENGIMSDLKLFEGAFSMKGMGDIKLPFGIKANVGLDLGWGEGKDWIPDFDLNNVGARLKLFDGIEDLISIGSKEKPKELISTVPKKVRIVVPRVGTLTVNVTVGVEGYAQAGVQPIWINGMLQFPDDYEFDLSTPTMPDIALKDGKISTGVSGEAMVRPRVEAGVGDRATVFAGLGAGLPITASIAGDMSGAADLELKGGALSGDVGLDLAANAAFQAQLKFFIELAAFEEFFERFELLTLPVAGGSLFELNKSWGLELGTNIGTTGQQSETSDSDPVLAPSSLKEQSEVQSEKNSKGGESAQSRNETSGGTNVLGKLQAASTLADLMINGFGIFSNIFDVVQAFALLDPKGIASFVIDMPGRADQLVNNCKQFEAAAREAKESKAVFDLLNEQLPFGSAEAFMEVLEFYLTSVDGAYMVINDAVSMTGVETPEQLRKRIAAQEALRDTQQNIVAMLRRKYQREGFGDTAANNLALVRAEAFVTTGPLEGGLKERARRLESEYRQLLEKAEERAQMERLRLMSAGVLPWMVEDIVDMYEELYAMPPHGAVKHKNGSYANPDYEPAVTRQHAAVLQQRIERAEAHAMERSRPYGNNDDH